ncbi:MAG: MBL fold metallo-hydrolase [Candidatus Thorarchaeota archaeon]
MGITIKFLAHASFQIIADGMTLYIDPSTKYTGLKDKDFTQVDYILVTHKHDDHCDPKLIKKIRKLGHPVIAPPNCKDAIKGIMWDLPPGQFMQISDGPHVRAVHAYNITHTRPNGEPYHPKGFGVGYIITIDGKKIYHAGDTDIIPEMDTLGMIDVALLPAGGTFTMDLEEAAEATKRIDPEVVIPMHLKGADPTGFKTSVEGSSSVKVVLLSEGEEYTLE